MAKIDSALPTADKDNVINPNARNWPLNSINQFEDIGTGDTCNNPQAYASLQETELWLFQRKSLDY